MTVAAMEAVAEHSMIRDFGAGRPDVQDGAELPGLHGKNRLDQDGFRRSRYPAGKRQPEALRWCPV